jgi:hypothetical protein
MCETCGKVGRAKDQSADAEAVAERHEARA